jgi:hypothetical protein
LKVSAAKNFFMGGGIIVFIPFSNYYSSAFASVTMLMTKIMKKRISGSGGLQDLADNARY